MGKIKIKIKMAKKTTTKSTVKISQPTEKQSVSIDKISNGYLITKSGCDKKGNYTSEKIYSKENPIKGM